MWKWTLRFKADPNRWIALLAALRVDGAPLMVAIDDQWGPKTDAVRLGTLSLTAPMGGLQNQQAGYRPITKGFPMSRRFVADVQCVLPNKQLGYATPPTALVGRLLLGLVGIAVTGGPAWAACETGTPPARMDCLTAQVNRLLSRLSNTQAEVADLEDALATEVERSDTLECQLADMTDLFDYVSVDTGTDSVVFTGANVYVQSGSGATDAAVNGLGNLIVGYGEDGTYFGGSASDRGGSHNLVVGGGASYTSYGGFVAGYLNTVNGSYSSVSGGAGNYASHYGTSVSGGSGNFATGELSSVSGGVANYATGYYSSVSGGEFNYAVGTGSSVSGGFGNAPSGDESSVSGGSYNNARGDVSSVSGGSYNEAWRTNSSVSGGAYNSAGYDNSSISGGYGNQANNYYSSVSGGFYNEASGEYSSVSGGSTNSASGSYSSVLGGNGVTVSAAYGTSPF